MEKSCITCSHKSKGLLDEPCNSCTILKCSENVVGRAYMKWEPAHLCLTCKHFNKKITEEPCINCNICLRNDKWEAKE